MDALLLSYAQDLNDAYPKYEFSIWSRQLLLSYFNEAICLIASQRPDMFTELRVIKISPCDEYVTLCDDCVQVLDVLGQSDAQGRNIRPIPRMANNTAVWQGRRKAQGFTDTISQYELLPSGDLLRVYPHNLDPSKDIYIAVRCRVKPKT